MAHAVHEPETHNLHEVADAQHGHAEDPNAAPMHHDIKEYFGSTQTFLAGLLGVVAIAGGIIFGLVLANN